MLTTTHFDITEHRAPCQHIRQYPRATSYSEEDELYLAVKQYTPRKSYPGDHKNGTGITILACHANGSPKELYEPFWDALYDYMQRTRKVYIQSIWIADAFNQGQSGVVNEQKLGNDPSWFDHARDVLTMVTHFRKEMKQPIVGFGHSMGGTVLLNVALMHPRLFATLVTFEPMVFKHPGNYVSLGAYAITFRKDKWASREDAAQMLHKHSIYKSWDPAVLELFIQYGLRDLPTALHTDPPPSDSTVPVTLTTTKHQEVSSYSRAAFPSDRSTPLSEFKPCQSMHPDIGDTTWRHTEDPFYRPETTLTYSQLPHLRPSCLLLYGAETVFVTERQLREDRTKVMGAGVGGSGGVASGRVKEIEVPGGGHFLPFESPRKLAEDVVGPWFEEEMERWTAEAETESKAREKLSAAQRSQVSDDWFHWMKTHNNPKKVTRAMRLKL